jgi:hypothetical protein
MHRKGSPMNLAGARNAVLHGNPKWGTAAAGMVSQTVRCMRQFAPPAAKKQPYRSSPVGTDRYTAETATNRNPVETAGKPLN